jgi:hypothetical protein
MSLIDNIYQNIAQRVVDQLQARLVDNGNQHIVTARKYRLGVQPKQLKVRANQHDDNLTLNFAGLVVNRGVSQLLGNGFSLDFAGETETAQEQYITAVLDANKQEILFHRAALSASEAGTGYLLIVPDGVVGADGQTYPRLVVIDPAFVTMETLPEDYELVVRYIQQYKFTAPDGKEKARRVVYQHSAPEMDADGQAQGGNTWEIVTSESVDAFAGQWREISRQLWSYDFAPIIHWQNLPAVGTPYGESDIPYDVLRLQDTLNFSSSNLAKIVRLFAHPMRYGKNLGHDGKTEAGPDAMPNYNNEKAEIVQLPAVGDLAAALEVFKSQRQAFFDITRSVDIDSMADKLGALTNFGLRVLYQDNLAKVATKRELFGDMLAELIRRLLVLAGMQPVAVQVVFPDFLPQDEAAEAQGHIALVGAGLESKQTAADALGLDWEQEQERMSGEQVAGDNIGAAILRAFENGA